MKLALLAVTATTVLAIIGAIAIAVRIGLSILELAHRAETAVFGNQIPEGSRFAGEIKELKGLGGKIAQISTEVRDRRDSELRMSEELSRMVVTDSLTGIGNRASLNAKLLEVSRSGAAAAVALIDLDHFKEVNDQFGHQAGDIVICEAARRIKHKADAATLVARIGGDEFAFIIEGPDALAEAAGIARALVVEMQEPIAIGDGQANIGASIGVARLGADPEASLHSADLALYRVKQRGRGGYLLFDEGFRAEIEHEARQKQILIDAIKNRKITAQFQPKIDLATGSLSGFEALARLSQADGDPILPPDLISVAENNGLIVQFGESVLRTAVAQAATWRQELHISVNISSIQLSSSGFAATVQDALTSSGLAPHRLELEISENALAGNVEAAMAGLLRLKTVGCRIVMDDFFSGHTSLRLLRSIPFDKIKLDPSFVADIASDPSCEKIVRALLQLCKELGIETTAEGVETEAQYELLTSAGCSEGQGFFLGQPLSAEAVPVFIRDREMPGRRAGEPAYDSQRLRRL